MTPEINAADFLAWCYPPTLLLDHISIDDLANLDHNVTYWPFKDYVVAEIELPAPGYAFDPVDVLPLCVGQDDGLGEDL